MAPRIRRKIVANHRIGRLSIINNPFQASSSGAPANDSASSSFLASYQKAKGPSISTIAAVDKMRQELKEREEKLISDLNRFKTQTTYSKARSKIQPKPTYDQSSVDITLIKQEIPPIMVNASSFISASPKIITIDGLAETPKTPIAPFPVFQESKQYQEYKSYLASQQEASPILQGSFTQIYDFPSNELEEPDNIDDNIAPGSSKIASPTKTFHTSERTSPIKDEDEKKVVYKKSNSNSRTKVSKPRRHQAKRKTFKQRARSKNPSSPPNSPLSDFAIDPQFLQNFKGIWCKTLPRPLIIPNPSSPDCFI